MDPTKALALRNYLQALRNDEYYRHEEKFLLAQVVDALYAVEKGEAPANTGDIATYMYDLLK